MRVSLALLFALLPSLTAAQNHFALELLRPLAIGASGTGLDADNRIYRAYQGIPYEIQATARGGQWPYTYSLTGAPTGMTVDAGPCTTIGPTCTAGKIIWTDPQATDSSITLQVCDVDLDCVSATWGVTVSTTACGSADGWCFIDSVNGNDTTGNGSLSTPWATLAKVWSTVSADSNILYLRAGTYPVTGMTQTTPGDCFQQVAWNENTRPVTWIGFPSETVTIDYEYDSGVSTSGPCMEFTGANIWVENLRLRNVRSMAFQWIRSSGYGGVAWRIDADDLSGGADGSNSAYIMWVSEFDNPSYGDTVSHSTMTGVTSSACFLKLYSVRRGVLDMSTLGTSTAAEGTIALKAEVPDYTARGNVSTGALTTFGGNMNGEPSGSSLYSTGGEILHNYVADSGTASSEGTITLGVARVEHLGEFFIYRNTFAGQVNISNAVSTDGPYRFTNNVIVNGQAASGSCPAQFTCYSVTDYTRLVETTNLKGADDGSVINGSGELTGAYLSYLGTRGYQSDAASGPVRLRIRGGG